MGRKQSRRLWPAGRWGTGLGRAGATGDRRRISGMWGWLPAVPQLVAVGPSLLLNQKARTWGRAGRVPLFPNHRHGKCQRAEWVRLPYTRDSDTGCPVPPRLPVCRQTDGGPGRAAGLAVEGRWPLASCTSQFPDPQNHTRTSGALQPSGKAG